MAKAKSQSVVPIERIAVQIFLIRGENVMLDAALAELYGVETRTLVQAVKRNAERFPEDFMFQLSNKEFENLRSQIVMSSWGGRRYPPYAFTEQGVAMLSGVFRSKTAVKVHVAIMRTFVRLRRMLAGNEEIAVRWPNTTGKSASCSNTFKDYSIRPRHHANARSVSVRPMTMPDRRNERAYKNWGSALVPTKHSAGSLRPRTRKAAPLPHQLRRRRQPAHQRRRPRFELRDATSPN